MADGGLPPVDALSDAGSADALPPVEALSDASSADEPPQRRRKKPRLEKVHLSLDHELRLRAVVGRNCCCKKKNCFAQFSSGDDFQAFQKFRADWVSFHKLDQDQIVSGPMLFIVDGVNGLRHFLLKVCWDLSKGLAVRCFQFQQVHVSPFTVNRSQNRHFYCHYHLLLYHIPRFYVPSSAYITNIVIARFWCAQAFDTIRGQLEGPSSKWTFLGKEVCLKSWKALHCLGASAQWCFLAKTVVVSTQNVLASPGSRRFNKLKTAAANEDIAPPVDIRYLKKPESRSDSEGRSSAVSFLMQIYTSVAETLPDYRDESWDIDTTLVSLQEIDKQDNQDPYAEHLRNNAESPVEPPNVKAHAKVKGQKIRKMKRSVQLNLHRRPEVGMYEEKWLPPGQMKDFWEQYRLAQADAPSVSFKTFWKVPGSLLQGVFSVYHLYVVNLARVNNLNIRQVAVLKLIYFSFRFW